MDKVDCAQTFQKWKKKNNFRNNKTIALFLNGLCLYI